MLFVSFNQIVFRHGFVRSKAILRPGSTHELNRLVELLNKQPEMKIEIHGHTDNTGSAELNVQLSEKRAETVKNYLIQKGIAADRVGSKGFGGSKPIADNSHEVTRKLNRRVEFVIVE